MTLLGHLLRSARNRARAATMRSRGLMTQILQHGGLQSGRALGVGRNVDLVIYGEVVFGEGVILSDGCAIEVGPYGRLVLGDGVFIGRHSVIAAQRSIEIGSNVLVAEHCSIRDQDHQLAASDRSSERATRTDPITIGAGVWLGAGVRVLKGSKIGAGSVVGANAVVRGEIPADVVAAGVPARILRTIQKHP